MMLTVSRFLLARLFIRSLRQQTKIKGLRDAIDGLPSDIDQQYDDTWQRIEQQNSEHRLLAKRVIGWLAHAARPLTVQELRYELAVQMGDTGFDEENLDAEDLLEPCCYGLVTIDRLTNVIGFIHHTAEQYYRDRDRSSELFPAIQSKILSTCLTYLSLNEFNAGPCTFISFNASDVNHVANGRKIARKRFLDTRLEEYPFMLYAATHWGRHVTEQAECACKGMILAFLRMPMHLQSALQVQESRLPQPALKDTEDLTKHLPLFTAVSLGLRHVLVTLLEDSNAVDIDKQYGSHRITLLHIAVQALDVEVTRIIMNAGANPRIHGGLLEPGQSALNHAISVRHNELVEIILAKDEGAALEPDIIHCATYYGCEAALRSMVTQSRSCNERAQRISSIYHRAAFLGRCDVLKLAREFAISAKVDLEAPNEEGQTALQIAIRHGRADAVQLLLESSASTSRNLISEQDLLRLSLDSMELFRERLQCLRDFQPINEDLFYGQRGSTIIPYTRSAETWFVDRVAAYFDEFPQCQDLFALPAFRELVFDDTEHERIVASLLKYNSELSERDALGENLLHLAVRRTLQRVHMLLKNQNSSLDINAVDNDGRTALHLAAARSRVDVMAILLEYGAAIGAQDKHHATTLHFSVNSTKCTELSIKRGYLSTHRIKIVEQRFTMPSWLRNQTKTS